MLRDNLISVVLAAFLLFSTLTIVGQPESFTARFSELEDRISINEDQPPASSNDIYEYLRWMEIQAKDRDDANELLEEINALAAGDPSNEEYPGLAKKAYYLQLRAQAAGDGTANMAAMKFIYVTSDKFPKSGDWETALWRVQFFGRKIAEKAGETGFSQSLLNERVHCCLNFCVADIECNNNGLGLYESREVEFGYMDENGIMKLHEGEFEVICEPRERFVLTAKGEPMREMSWAFTNIQRIREECNWWTFEDIYKDATDVMNDYYRDALCRVPPHRQKEGHKTFKDLAEEYSLPPSEEYNEGFYGTIYGKVEIKDGNELYPADGAEVTIKDIGQEWKVTADQNGKYESRAIMHTECSPFRITAVHEGDFVEDTYEGILEQPDSNYRLRKDLVIIRNREYEWVGKLMLMHDDISKCLEETGDIRTIRKERHTFYKFDVRISAKDINFSEEGSWLMDAENAKMEGDLEYLYDHLYEMEFPGKTDYIHELETQKGHQSYNISSVAVSISITTKMTDPSILSEKLAEGLNDPENLDAMMEELEAMMTGKGKDQFPVTVMITFTEPHFYMQFQYRYRKDVSGGHEPVIKEEEGKKQMLATVPMVFMFDGTYHRGEDGRDRISAGLNESSPAESRERDCPPEGSVTNRFRLEMSRVRVK